MIEFEGRNIPMTLAEIADPRRAVLLVWDMQNDQAGSSFNKAEFLRATPPLIAAAKGAGVRVVYAFATPYAWRDEVERFAEVVDSRELLEIWGGPAGSG